MNDHHPIPEFEVLIERLAYPSPHSPLLLGAQDQSLMNNQEDVELFFDYVKRKQYSAVNTGGILAAGSEEVHLNVVSSLYKIYLAKRIRALSEINSLCANASVQLPRGSKNFATTHLRRFNVHMEPATADSELFDLDLVKLSYDIRRHLEEFLRQGHNVGAEETYVLRSNVLSDALHNGRVELRLSRYIDTLKEITLSTIVRIRGVDEEHIEIPSEEALTRMFKQHVFEPAIKFLNLIVGLKVTLDDSFPERKRPDCNNKSDIVVYKGGAKPGQTRVHTDDRSSFRVGTKNWRYEALSITFIEVIERNLKEWMNADMTRLEFNTPAEENSFLGVFRQCSGYCLQEGNRTFFIIDSDVGILLNFKQSALESANYYSESKSGKTGTIIPKSKKASAKDTIAVEYAIIKSGGIGLPSEISTFQSLFINLVLKQYDYQLGDEHLSRETVLSNLHAKLMPANSTTSRPPTTSSAHTEEDPGTASLSSGTNLSDIMSGNEEHGSGTSGGALTTRSGRSYSSYNDQHKIHMHRSKLLFDYEFIVNFVYSIRLLSGGFHKLWQTYSLKKETFIEWLEISNSETPHLMSLRNRLVESLRTLQSTYIVFKISNTETRTRYRSAGFYTEEDMLNRIEDQFYREVKAYKIIQQYNRSCVDTSNTVINVPELIFFGKSFGDLLCEIPFFDNPSDFKLAENFLILSGIPERTSASIDPAEFEKQGISQLHVLHNQLHIEHNDLELGRNLIFTHGKLFFFDFGNSLLDTNRAGFDPNIQTDVSCFDQYDLDDYFPDNREFSIVCEELKRMTEKHGRFLEGEIIDIIMRPY